MSQFPINSGLSLEDMLQFLDVNIILRQDCVIVELDYFNSNAPEFVDLFVAYFGMDEFQTLPTYVDIITAAIERADFQPMNNENDEDYEQFI